MARNINNPGVIEQMRDMFLDAAVPVGAPQGQINDMAMAFDAGATMMLQAVTDPGADLEAIVQEMEMACLMHLGDPKEVANVSERD